MKKKVLICTGILLMLMVGFSGCSSDDDENARSGGTPSLTETNVLQLVTDKSQTSSLNVVSSRCRKVTTTGDRVTDILYELYFSCTFGQSSFFKALDIALSVPSDPSNLKAGDTFDISQFSATLELRNNSLEEVLLLAPVQSGRMTVVDRKLIDGKTAFVLEIKDFKFDTRAINQTDVYTMNGTIEYILDDRIAMRRMAASQLPPRRACTLRMAGNE